MEVLKLKILDFKYNGKYLSDFGFKVAKTIDNTFGLNREIVVGNINTIRNKPNHYGVKYTNTLPLKYLIMKDPCTNNSQGKLYLIGSTALISKIHSSNKLLVIPLK